MFLVPFAFVLSMRGWSNFPPHVFHLKTRKQNPFPLLSKPLFRSLNSNPILQRKRKKSKRNEEELEDPSVLNNADFDEDDKMFGPGAYTLANLAQDSDFPIEFLVSSVVQMGVNPPIDLRIPLNEMMDKDQISALFEAIMSMHPSDAHMRLTDESLSDIADHFEVELSHVFQLCGKLKLDLPMGISTHLRTNEYEALVDALEEETGILGKRELETPKVPMPDLVSKEAIQEYHGLREKQARRTRKEMEEMQFGAEHMH